MRKRTITWFFLIGLVVAVVVGGINGGGMATTMKGVILAGASVSAIGLFLVLVSWIGAWLRQANRVVRGGLCWSFSSAPLSQPDYVVVLLGENDVLALISPQVAQFDRLTKHLPVQPTPEWYRENMQVIVRYLKRDTSARIALCSLIPIGEDPDSQHPFQAAANRRIEEYSAILKDRACQEEVSYLPLYERLRDLIRASPGRTFTSFDFLPFYRDAFRQFVLRKSNDEIGQLNGWHFHRDGIHLNSRSGKLLADLVQGFLLGTKISEGTP